MARKGELIEEGRAWRARLGGESVARRGEHGEEGTARRGGERAASARRGECWEESRARRGGNSVARRRERWDKGRVQKVGGECERWGGFAGTILFQLLVARQISSDRKQSGC